MGCSNSFARCTASAPCLALMATREGSSRATTAPPIVAAWSATCEICCGQACADAIQNPAGDSVQTRAVFWGLFRESLRGVGEAPDRVVTVLIELHAGALEMLELAMRRAVILPSSRGAAATSTYFFPGDHFEEVSKLQFSHNHICGEDS